MKLIAIHEIVRKPKAVQPGEEFEATDKEAAELIGLGAAKAAEEPVVEESAPQGRKKKKDPEVDEGVI